MNALGTFPEELSRSQAPRRGALCIYFHMFSREDKAYDREAVEKGLSCGRTVSLRASPSDRTVRSDALDRLWTLP